MREDLLNESTCSAGRVAVAHRRFVVVSPRGLEDDEEEVVYENLQAENAWSNVSIDFCGTNRPAKPTTRPPRW